MNNKPTVGDLILTLFIWALAGALFGSLFAALHDLFVALSLKPWQALVAGSTVAAVTTAAFYAAMPVALAGTMAGILSSIATLIATGHQLTLVLNAGVAGAAGLATGALYAWLIADKGTPLARTLSGFVAGLLAGGLVALASTFFGPGTSMFLLAAGVVALVGASFQLSGNKISAFCAGWFPGLLSAPIVSGLIAAVVGASVWVMGGATAMGTGPETKAAIDLVLHQVPAGFLGGMSGGAVTGIVLELLGVNLNVREQLAKRRRLSR